MLGSVSPCSLTTVGGNSLWFEGKGSCQSVSQLPASHPTSLANLPVRELIISQFNDYLYIKDQELN
jgi:hypothetical protein